MGKLVYCVFLVFFYLFGDLAVVYVRSSKFGGASELDKLCSEVEKLWLSGLVFWGLAFCSRGDAG